MINNIKSWLKKDGKIFLEDIGIKKGQIIMDFGCGSGHYTIPAGKVVGENGKIYALDKDREVLRQLMNTSKSESLKNIVTICNQSEELKINLDEESIDAILLYDVLHYMNSEKRRIIYKNAYRILKTNALFSVYPKHNKSDQPMGELADMQLENIIEEIKSSKFYLDKEFFKRLVHDNNYNMGHILNFKKYRNQ
jgi:ubiquinone/menaquinone biosynthesis C-methylase UbiE